MVENIWKLVDEYLRRQGMFVLLLGSTEGGESAARLEGMCGIDGTVTAAWLSVRGECKSPLDRRDRCHCNWSKKKSGSV